MSVLFQQQFKGRFPETSEAHDRLYLELCSYYLDTDAFDEQFEGVETKYGRQLVYPWDRAASLHFAAGRWHSVLALKPSVSNVFFASATQTAASMNTADLQRMCVAIRRRLNPPSSPAADPATESPHR